MPLRAPSPHTRRLRAVNEARPVSVWVADVGRLLLTELRRGWHLRTRLTAGAAVAALVLTGCGALKGAGSPPAAAAGRDSDTIAYLRQAGWRTDFNRRSVPLSDFQSGGPPRDGIPPIDQPKLTSVEAAGRFLSPGEPVIAVQIAGRARAYPEQILVWHEIVNDSLGGRPIAVTYCPLCNSALVFDRRVEGRTVTFGTTGMLRNSDLVMWDRRTQSWWQQLTGQAVVGAQTGLALTGLDDQVLSFQQFRERYPQGTVLSRDTGFDRPYGINPYEGYDRRPPAFYRGRPDPRLPAKERVVAILGSRSTDVIPFARLRRERVVAGQLDGGPYVVLFSRRVTSALDAEQLSRSGEVGTAGVFDPRLGGHLLTFAGSGDGFVDRQSGSHWDITGRAISGSLRGRQLVPRRHDEQFWFALAAFLPRARLDG
ncbi:MAG: DUF3179 domain-containing protein [Thermoleophilaceae bacterium]